MVTIKGILRGSVLAVRSLRSDIRTIFTPPPEAEAAAAEAEAAAVVRRWERIEKHPVYRYPKLIFRYGMLTFILGLLAFHIWIDLKFPAPSFGDPYIGYICDFMLLFSHLAFFFEWPKRVARFLWILALSWLAFAFFYTLYLSDILYPLPPLPNP